MFTTVDKALVALVGSIMFLANEFLGFSFGLEEETFQTLVALLVPVAVWAWPNKHWS